MDAYNSNNNLNNAYNNDNVNIDMTQKETLQEIKTMKMLELQFQRLLSTYSGLHKQLVDNTNKYLDERKVDKNIYAGYTGSSTETPKYIGCYNDKNTRAIPTYRGNMNLKNCAQVAWDSGDTIFGLQSPAGDPNNAQCFTGNDIDRATQYGSGITNSTSWSSNGDTTSGDAVYLTLFSVGSLVTTTNKIPEDDLSDFTIGSGAVYSSNDTNMDILWQTKSDNYSYYYRNWKKTQKQDNGGGQVNYLDRQGVYCGGPRGIIQSASLYQSSNNEIGYAVSCARSKRYKASWTTNYTDWTSMEKDGGNFSSLSLINQNVDCGPDAALNQFRMRTQYGSDPQLRYQYKCGKITGSLICRQVQGPEFDDGGGNTSSLVNQGFTCNKDEVLQQFQLTQPSDGKLQYNYTCCKNIASDSCFLTMQDDGNLAIYNGSSPTDKTDLIWQTNTNKVGNQTNQDWINNRAFGRNYMVPGEYLSSGQFLCADNGKVRAILQSDGTFQIQYVVSKCTPLQGNTYGGSWGNAVYTIPMNDTSMLGEAVYIDKESNYYKIPDSMFRGGKDFYKIRNYRHIDNENMGVLSGVSSNSKTGPFECKEKCVQDDDCGGFEYDRDNQTCNLKSKTQIFPKGARVSDSDYDIYLRLPYLENDSSCTSEVQTMSVKEYGDTLKDLKGPQGVMTPKSACGLKKETQNDRNALQNELNAITTKMGTIVGEMNKLSQKDKSYMKMKPELQSKLLGVANKYKTIFNKIEKDKKGAEVLSVQSDDSYSEAVSNNYKYVVWSVGALATVGLASVLVSRIKTQ